MDVYLTVEQAMTEAERKDFLAKVTYADSRLRGAEVADVLQMYDDGDAMLVDTEPFWTLNGDWLSGQYERDLVRAAAVAAAVLRPDQMLEQVERILKAT